MQEHLGEEVEAENRKEQEALLAGGGGRRQRKKESPESVQKPSDSAETKKTDGKQKENVEKKDEIKKETSAENKRKRRKLRNRKITPIGEHSDKSGSKRKEDLWRRSRERTQETVALPHPQIDSVSCETGRF